VTTQDTGYLRRLAELDAVVGQAQLDPHVAVERAAGLLAGRIGGRVDEMHALIVQRAIDNDRSVAEVAAEILTALQGRSQSIAGSGRAAADEALLSVGAAVGLATGRADHTGDGGSDDWVVVVQQVLATTGGRHTVVVPLHGTDQEVKDFRIVAASPSGVDLSGRRGAEVVGRLASELYPSVVGGPVWDAWQQTLADGLPREIGPFPYSGGPAGTQTPVSLVVRVAAVGSGVINSWVRNDEQVRLAERIAQTERLGSMGWVEWDLVTDATIWSDGMYGIYERDPADGPMPREESDALILPEQEALRRQARESFGRGETADAVLRIRVGDRVKHIRAVLDAARDATGRPLKIYGIVQDVTVRETSRARLAEVEGQLREYQLSLAAEQALAVRLQQIVLPIPAEPIDLPGLRVAVRYLPAEQASHVGGDWFHAAPAPDGSVLLAVGDVAGHGIAAATTMAQLRHALAAFAVTTTEPARLLSLLNDVLFQAYPLTPTASAVIVRYHPGGGTLSWAQAGHPAPLSSRVGVTTELDRPRGPLLGAVRHAHYSSAAATIQPGELLVLYTDGLIEHRAHTLAEGLAPVTATLNEITAEPREQPLADLLARLRRANPEDDTCILAARLTQAPHFE
jgi:serine phosphatase RsbU (regulator of sigma subunit)